jgi:hypothetical protein
MQVETDWIPMDQQPAYVGWYEVLHHAGGVMQRYWRGPLWWGMCSEEFEIDTRLAVDPGTHWRGLSAPTEGVRYEPIASQQMHAVSRRILFTGK